MSVDKNIVVLGGSWAGLNSTHYFLKHVRPALPKDGSNYRIVMLNPSSKFWHRVGGPRAIISGDSLPKDKLFQDIPSKFKDYPAGSYQFIEASATGVDTNSRTVSYRVTKTGEENIVPYHALVIATGVSASLDAFNNLDDESVLQSHLDDMRAKIGAAKSVIIGGGGPTGAETAGEVGSHLNGEPGMWAGANTNPKVPITLVTAADRLIPVLRPAIGKTAEQYLRRLGVDVRYNSRIESVKTSDKGGQTTITLSTGEQLTADLYIPALGMTPNTSYLPKHLLTADGHVDSNLYLRVPSAGPRVYATGDVGAHAKRGGVMAINGALPVLMTNLQRDLEAYSSDTDESANIPQGPDREFKEDLSETQVAPIGRGKGVGAMMNWKLPSVLVWLLKGRDYMLWSTGLMLKGKMAMLDKWNPPAPVKAA